MHFIQSARIARQPFAENARCVDTPKDFSGREAHRILRE
jgi:hypothetical protein